MQERIRLYLDLIACSQPLLYWRYDAKGNLLESTCPTEKMLDDVFRATGALDEALHNESGLPMILGSNSLLRWIAERDAGETDDVSLHVLGPFFATEVRTEGVKWFVRQAHLSDSEPWNRALTDTLLSLPALSVQFYCQYALMLHFLLTGNRVTVGEIQYSLEGMEAVPADFSNLKIHTKPKDRKEVYRLERALLNAVREGDVEGVSAMSLAGHTARVRQYTNDPLRNMQIACTTFVTLCTRAAIEGGLSTTMSYSLGDAYIKSIFLAKSSAEIQDIKDQMYRDFITRVHNCRHNPEYSNMVQGCCDYIELHVAEPLSIETLADRMGYAKYYLSARFKKETGVSVGAYIKFARVERAKLLLATTDKDIAEIAEETGFASRSFFSNTFKRCLGMTPAAYRRNMASM